MKKCSYCKSEIDSKASVCPVCHRKLSFSFIEVIFYLIIAFIVIAFIYPFFVK
jgi:RNA polymerase subunit RPABC4/transcription elongation factor Spt4